MENTTIDRFEGWLQLSCLSTKITSRIFYRWARKRFRQAYSQVAFCSWCSGSQYEFVPRQCNPCRIRLCHRANLRGISIFKLLNQYQLMSREWFLWHWLWPRASALKTILDFPLITLIYHRSCVLSSVNEMVFGRTIAGGWKKPMHGAASTSW